MKAVKGDVRAPHAGFFCELCDCFFNDEHARTMHCKGRRHRLNYKVKGVRSFSASCRFYTVKFCAAFLTCRCKKFVCLGIQKYVKFEYCTIGLYL